MAIKYMAGAALKQWGGGCQTGMCVRVVVEVVNESAYFYAHSLSSKQKDAVPRTCDSQILSLSEVLD